MNSNSQNKPERLETLFALEFGQLLENHIFGSPNRDKLIEVICSSLGLRSKQQLAQIFAGFDVPSTANIFELIRTLNSPEFTERFLSLQTTLLSLNLKPVPEETSEVLGASETSETSDKTDEKPSIPYWMLGDKNTEAASPLAKRETVDPLAAEWGDEDFDFSMFN